MHPKLVRYIEIAKALNPSLKVGLDTNGLLLGEDLFGKMLDAGLDWLRVSLHTSQSCLRFKEVQEWNAKRGGYALIAGDVDTTKELIVAISMGFTQDVLSQMDIANWAGYLTGYRKVHADAVAHAESLRIRQTQRICRCMEWYCQRLLLGF